MSAPISALDDATAPAVVEPPWTIDEVVDRLVDARRGGARPSAARVASALRDATDAYRVQSLVERALWPGVESVVWKAGADGRDSLPTAASIAPPLVFANGATLSTAAFPIRIVEAEIAYRFGADLPPRETPYAADEVAEAVASMHAAIEVVSPRIVDVPIAAGVDAAAPSIASALSAAPPLAKLADHLVNGAFVLGDGTTAWRKVDLRRQPATLALGGRVHESAVGSHALGNPAVLLPWFVAHLGRLPVLDDDGRPGPSRGVRAGDVVTTGSWTKVIEARRGQRVEASFEGLGTASLAFD